MQVTIIPKNTILYHKTNLIGVEDIHKISHYSHFYTINPPSTNITERGKIILIYKTSRDIKVLMEKNTSQYPLKFHVSKFVTGIFPDDYTKVNINAILSFLSHTYYDAIITRMDNSNSQLYELILVYPPITFQTPIIFDGFYIM